jgi:mono/diheme cytochrome c family protein
MAMQALKFLVLAAALGLWSLSPASAQPLFGPTQDPLAGSRVFGAKGCSKCHAANGVGGKVGPDLGRISRFRSFYDLAAAMWNHLPQMGKQMRDLGIIRPHLSTREAGDLIAFLYTLDYFDRPGDKKLGRQLFIKKRCVSCHQAGGVGGVVGPNLDKLAQYGSPILVASAMWNHGPAMADAMQAAGMKRPTFSGSELGDLLSYLNALSPQRRAGPIYVLPGRPDDGQRLFQVKRCIECHSIRGRGGKGGGELAARRLKVSLTQFAAAMWNKAPSMLREMKRKNVPLPSLSAEEVADIVAYLYSVQYFAGPGDSRKGRKLARLRGCLKCHSVDGKGGKAGPDFQEVRGLDQPVAIISAMWNHAGTMERKMEQQSLTWPALSGEELGNLVAFIEKVGRGR